MGKIYGLHKYVPYCRDSYVAFFKDFPTRDEVIKQMLVEELHNYSGEYEKLVAEGRVKFDININLLMEGDQAYSILNEDIEYSIHEIDLE